MGVLDLADSLGFSGIALLFVFFFLFHSSYITLFMIFFVIFLFVLSPPHPFLHTYHR